MLLQGVLLWDEMSVALPEEKPNKPSRRANACPQIEGSVSPPHLILNLLGLPRLGLQGSRGLFLSQGHRCNIPTYG